MNLNDRDSIVKELDKYIEDNFGMVTPGFNALHSEKEEKERLESFIKETRCKAGREMDVFFANILEDMMKQLGSKPPEIYNPALITKDHWSKLLGPDRPHPKKFTVIALGFALIQADVKKNNPLKLPPEERMNTLLYSGGGIDYTLKNSSVFDLVIKFCLQEKVYDVDNVNFFLAHKKLPMLPNGKEE